MKNTKMMEAEIERLNEELMLYEIFYGNMPDREKFEKIQNMFWECRNKNNLLKSQIRMMQDNIDYLEASFLKTPKSDNLKLAEMLAQKANTEEKNDNTNSCDKT